MTNLLRNQTTYRILTSTSHRFCTASSSSLHSQIPISRRIYTTVPTTTTATTKRNAHPTNINSQTVLRNCIALQKEGRRYRQYSTMSSATSFFDFKTPDKKGKDFDLSSLKGKVVLVVNTASKCGFTPQFEGLEKLYKELKAAHPNDVEFLGFPCNQFGSQDPGSNDEIQSFCQVNYGVSFPVLGKVDVNGDSAAPVFEWLKSEKPGLLGLKRVKWNFEKFLVGKDGRVIGRWASTTKPETLKGEIEKAIKASK